MPEGPEIRLEADRIEAAIAGHEVEEVHFGLPRLRAFEQRLAGCTVERIETRGKALLTHFDNGLSMYSHNQLYGRWYVRPRGEWPATKRSLRAALHTAEWSALLYSASEIEVLNAAGLAGHPFLSRLGPDALSGALDWRELATRLNDERFRNRAVSALYLDQSFLAGIGNYLRSEILFFAGVGPHVRPRELDRNGRARLARQSLAVTRRAYATRGVTNPAGRVKRLRREGAKRGAYRFAVFGRDGRPCYGCETRIERIDAGSRRLYLCPRCQAD